MGGRSVGDGDEKYRWTKVQRIEGVVGGSKGGRGGSSGTIFCTPILM